jgi:hypothetical protein
LDCPGSIGPLDTAALARRPIEPFRAGKVRFFWRERLDSMISEHKSFAYGQGLRRSKKMMDSWGQLKVTRVHVYWESTYV